MDKLTKQDIVALSKIFRDIVAPIENDLREKMDMICDRMDVIEGRYVEFGMPNKPALLKTIERHEHMAAILKKRLELECKK